jgi:hypothetical protein
LASTCIAVVLPDPAGASASATRAPLVAIAVTRPSWLRLSVASVEPGREHRQLDVIGRPGETITARSRRDDALLGVEDALARVAVTPGVPVDALAVATPQPRRLGDRVEVGGEVDRQSPEDVVDDPLDHLGQPVRVDRDVAHLPLCLGADVPDLPRRPASLQLGDDPRRCLPDPLRRHLPLRPRRRMQRHRDHPCHSPLRAEHAHGLGSPRAPLLDVRRRLVLGLPGLQVRLLRERDRSPTS